MSSTRGRTPETSSHTTGWKDRCSPRAAVVGQIESQFEKALLKKAQAPSSVTRFLDDVSDNVIDKAARKIYGAMVDDMHRYVFGKRGDVVRKMLTGTLDSLPASSRTCLIAHSMGSIIALDVILRGTRKIDTLVTVGSPLGIKVVQEQIGATPEKRRAIPGRVRRWYNFSDPLDRIALDSDLNDDFPEASVKDASIQNYFITREGSRNHHKSYGYLRDRAVGAPVAAFLK